MKSNVKISVYLESWIWGAEKMGRAVEEKDLI